MSEDQKLLYQSSSTAGVFGAEFSFSHSLADSRIAPSSGVTV